MGNVVPKYILPTLIIGIGGTGYQVIRRLKNTFKKRFGDVKLPVKYLLIDTDLKSFLDESIDNSEKCQLRFGDGIKRTLDWAYKNPAFDWLPNNPKITPDFFISTDQGAGLMRPIGKLYLCKNDKLVYDTITNAKNELLDLSKVIMDHGDSYLENIDRHKVYLVGSLAGGTGCGTFLDVAVMVSNIFNRDVTNVVGMFPIENCYDEKLSSDVDSQNRSKANCYAALKELEFYMASIDEEDDPRHTFKYPTIGDLRLDKKIFDICYLVENKNEDGGVLSNIEDIYELCALQLFHEVGTDLGANIRSDYANFICKDKDPVLNKDRHFSTFSSSSMEFPYESLKDFCAYSLAKDIAYKVSEGNIDPEEKNIQAKEVYTEIQNIFNVFNCTDDFTNKNKVSGEVKFEDLKNKAFALDRVANEKSDRIQEWNDAFERRKRSLKHYLKEYINFSTVNYGIKETSDILRSVQGMLLDEYEGSKGEFTLDKNTVVLEINACVSPKGGLFKSMKAKKIKNGKEPVPKEVVASYNRCLKEIHNSFKNYIYKSIYECVNKEIFQIGEECNILLSQVETQKNKLNALIGSIDYRIGKKYGGNIIAREIITKEYYDKFYKSYVRKELNNSIKAMFEDKNIIEVIRGGEGKLIEYCREEFDQVASKLNITIMDVLKENALKEGKTLDEYVSSELNITASLAKPFWSAKKNPEVSWTECYYIGSMYDKDLSNDMNARAPESIYKWIENQTGEKARKAKYVKTNDPYSIDIVHITMGACAAYLSDVLDYKNIYEKLLFSETYPLHLDERFVGLDEIDESGNKLFRLYTFAKVYGALMEKKDGIYLNIFKGEDGFKYIYKIKECIEDEKYFYKDNSQNIHLKEKAVVYKNRNELIRSLKEGGEVSLLLESFIKHVQRTTFTIELKNHISDYIKSNASSDFIVNEKLKYYKGSY